ncbi:MAG TPA: dienelactone hydrolase family protein [Streptosporangiaceae bacterium]|nr:dienelactone hydrolase family protein [Streptosporangiaceae bacterium]
MKETLTAETITIPGHNGDEIEAYLAKPGDSETFAGVVVIHHMPGYDTSTKEIARKFAAHGYAALMPNLYYRDAPDASPDDAAALVRAKGGVPDEQVVGDVGGAADYLRSLPGCNGKIGVIGYCSGGRQTFLVACSIQVQAAVDCYGGAVVRIPDFAPASMKSLVGLAENLSCPLLGLFGADDQFPTPDETGELSGVLDSHGKPHEFHTYEGASHAFFSVDRPSYRVDAATQGWEKVWEFFGKHLA